MKEFANGGKTPQEQCFAYRLSSAWMVIECAFGRLKARFGCLRRDMDISLKDLPAVIHSCFILHNFCELDHMMPGIGHDFLLVSRTFVLRVSALYVSWSCTLSPFRLFALHFLKVHCLFVLGILSVSRPYFLHFKRLLRLSLSFLLDTVLSRTSTKEYYCAKGHRTKPPY